MKNTNIQKIRQLLKKVESSMSGSCEGWMKEDIKEVLDLLPCETCNGTGEIPKPMPQEPHPCNYVNLKRAERTIPCPDCQKKPIELNMS